jgi:hypothetical protein
VPVPPTISAFQQTLIRAGTRQRERAQQTHPENPDFIYSHADFVPNAVIDVQNTSQSASLSALRRAQSIGHHQSCFDATNHDDGSHDDHDALRLAPSSPFTRRRKNGSLTRPTAFLTEEQRLIIDNASEEQGASDQSIERVILISEDLINRSLGGGGEVDDCDEEHATAYDKLYDGEDEGCEDLEDEEEELKAEGDGGDGDGDGDDG